MKIVSLQLPVVLSDVEVNKKRFLEAIAQLPDDKETIVVLPEMWSAGFDYKNLREYAKQTEGMLAEIMDIISPNTLVISTHPEESPDKVYNTVYAVTKNGVIGKYRKNFLFSPTGEDKYFDTGADTCVVEFKGVKVGILLCYEIRFPELFRQTAKGGAEIIVIPAIWPAMKKEHWQTLTRSRAIENQLYIAGCNCSVMHTTKKDMECGYSVAFDPWGESLYEPMFGECVLSCDADFARVADVREKIPSFADAMVAFKIERN